jgi:hypothetical protein
LKSAAAFAFVISQKTKLRGVDGTSSPLANEIDSFERLHASLYEHDGDKHGRPTQAGHAVYTNACIIGPRLHDYFSPSLHHVPWRLTAVYIWQIVQLYTLALDALLRICWLACPHYKIDAMLFEFLQESTRQSVFVSRRAAAKRYFVHFAKKKKKKTYSQIFIEVIIVWRVKHQKPHILIIYPCWRIWQLLCCHANRKCAETRLLFSDLESEIFQNNFF